MNIRLFNQMRAILVLATFLAVYIDPAEPQKNAALTYTVLALYNLYAILILFFSDRKPNLIPVNFTHWIDVAWCLILIVLSTGTSSIFFFLFFFAFLEAAFRFGYYEGLRVTFTSVILFTVFGYLTAPTGEAFELNRFLLRPVYLGVLGYMISFWGGQELTNKRRLAILKDIVQLYNPRFGVEQTTASIQQKILDSFESDSCLLITANRTSSGYFLRQIFKTKPEQAIYAERVENDNPLLTVPGEYAVIYNGDQNKRRAGGEKYSVFDLCSGVRVEQPERDGEVLADLLGTKSFISVPLHRRGAIAGRIYLTSNTKRFDHSDVEFLIQLLAHAVPVVENVNLLDRLASEATEQQRQRISRDIHDSTIQPYIGLKLGLEALQIKLEAGEDITADVARLVEMTNANINDIRSYINKLKADKFDTKKGSVLISAIKTQADRLGEFYGIEIKVDADDTIHINDRLSAEAFQIITEGLSNIRRHTKANRALIIIKCDDKKLKLEIRNNNPNGASANGFVPKSIAGRAESLGGQAQVRSDNNTTSVRVEIPL
jgi:signal transduction histidine kinase